MYGVLQNQLFLPLGGDLSIMNTSSMITVLKENNYVIDDTTPPHVVQEIYNIDLIGGSSHHNLAKHVNFPKYAANTLNDSCPSFVKEKIDFEIIDGGLFISDSEKILDKDVPCILELITAFVKVQPGYSHTNFDKGNFDVMPSMFVDSD